jgi:Bacterial membrane protein YfhO
MKLIDPEPSATALSSGIRQNSDAEWDAHQLNSGEFSHSNPLNRVRSRFLWVLLVSIGLLLALATPFLAGQIYTADDLGAFHLPMRAFYADCLAHGDAFDWSPQMYCGFYLTGEGQVGAYHPLHLLLYRWLPLGIAFDVECLVSYPLMLLGMYLLLRRWNIRRDAALFGGLTFTFSGFCLLHFVHVNGVAVVAHIPWLMLAIHAAIRGADRNRRRLGGIAVALLTGSQLLLGYPQYVWLSIVAEIGYVALLQRGERRGALDKRMAVADAASVGIRAIGTLVLWKTLGIMLGGVQLLPTLDALQHSSRQTADSSFGAWGSLDPLNLIQLVAPYLFVNRVVGQNTHELGLYAGSATLLLAAWCLFRRPAAVRMRFLVRTASLFVVVGLLLACGDHGPLNLFVARIPLVNRFRFPCRAIVLVHLGMAILAAIGLMSLSQSRAEPNGSSRRESSGMKAIWLLVGLSVLFAAVGPVWWPGHVAPAALVWTGPILLALAAVLLTLSRRGAAWARAGLILLSAVDLATYGMSYAVFPQTAVFDRYVASVPVPPGPATRRIALDLVSANRSGLHAGDQSLLLGWKRADGYAGLEPSRQLDYRQTVALRLAGVGWVAVGADAADRAAFQPASPDWLQIANPLPRARLVTQAVVSTDPARELTGIPLESTALVEQSIDLQAGRPGTALIVADRPGDIRIAVNSPTRQLLVLAESYHSGWQATSGDERRTIMRVNGDFMGCPVEPGKGEIHFRFRPASLRYGEWLSILGLGFIAATLLHSIRSGIRQNSEPSR